MFEKLMRDSQLMDEAEKIEEAGIGRRTPDMHDVAGDAAGLLVDIGMLAEMDTPAQNDLKAIKSDLFHLVYKIKDAEKLFYKK